MALFCLTGKNVSKSTISSFFNKCFMNKGSLCKPNFIPCVKFRPENYEKMLEYVATVSLLDPTRIKFGDEKHTSLTSSHRLDLGSCSSSLCPFNAQGILEEVPFNITDRLWVWCRNCVG